MGKLIYHLSGAAGFAYLTPEIANWSELPQQSSLISWGQSFTVVKITIEGNIDGILPDSLNLGATNTQTVSEFIWDQQQSAFFGAFGNSGNFYFNTSIGSQPRACNFATQFKLRVIYEDLVAPPSGGVILPEDWIIFQEFGPFPLPEYGSGGTSVFLNTESSSLYASMMPTGQRVHTRRIEVILLDGDDGWYGSITVFNDTSAQAATVGFNGTQIRSGIDTQLYPTRGGSLSGGVWYNFEINCAPTQPPEACDEDPPFFPPDELPEEPPDKPDEPFYPPEPPIVWPPEPTPIDPPLPPPDSGNCPCRNEYLHIAEVIKWGFQALVQELQHADDKFKVYAEKIVDQSQMSNDTLKDILDTLQEINDSIQEDTSQSQDNASLIANASPFIEVASDRKLRVNL